MTSIDLYAALIAPVADERNEMIEALDEGTSQLSITYFQQITTFFHLDTLSGLTPFLR